MVVRTVFLVLMLSATAICAQYSGGTGEPNDPYQIATAEDLMILGEESNDYDKHFILTADIDLDPNLPGGQVFDRAVIAPALDRNPDRNTLFTGVFDGNGHTISHLTIEGDEYLGLFGQIGSGARISNLALESVDINGTGEIGILAGVNEGHIINCSSTGSVSARSKHIGGLVGRNYGDIAQCFSDCVISGEGLAVGGLVGRNDGTISNCYCGGIIEGTQKTGGFVGYNLASVTNSYSSASVVSERSINGFAGYNEWQVHNCFWDVQTSGRLTSDGGTGLTTAEMQTTSTFLDAGWDFVDETENGTDDIWWILEGQDYPRLWWELIPEN